MFYNSRLGSDEFIEALSYEREKVVEDFRFYKMIKEDVEKTLQDQTIPDSDKEDNKNNVDCYNDYVESLKEQYALEFDFWSNTKGDPFYFMKIIEESGIASYDYDELQNIFQNLKEKCGDNLDKGLKKSEMYLLWFLYENQGNRHNNKDEMIKLLQICDINEDDLSLIPDDESRKNQKGTFKYDMIDFLENKQLKKISQMNAEQVRAEIDNYIKSDRRCKPKFINKYIERLKELNALDLVTIIELVNRGDMQNSDVIEFAINSDIDIESLNGFIYDDPDKTPTILQDFSNVLDSMKLAGLYKNMRETRNSDKEQAKLEFEKYAHFYQLYKIDKDGKEIEKFLLEFKKQNKRDPRRPLEQGEVVYLYEIGILGGKYALHANRFINILNSESSKNGQKVDNVRHSIISTIIEHRKLRVEDARELFKSEIEELYSKNDNVTEKMLDGTLLGTFFKQCTDDQKFGYILACDFSEEIDGKLLQHFLPYTVECENRTNRYNIEIKDDDNNDEKKINDDKSYIIIPYKTRTNQILSLDIPNTELSIDNGVLVVRSDSFDICIIEQLYINKIGEKTLKTGIHSTYVVKNDFFEEHKNYFSKTIKINNELHTIYDFSRLSRLSIENKGNGSIKKVLHRLEENNPNRNVIPWNIGLQNAVSDVSGRPISYKEKDDKDIYKALMEGAK